MVPSSVKEFLHDFRKGTLHVKEGTWAHSAYAYWRSHAHFKTTGYRENTCHIVRVLLLWVPFTWFLYSKPTSKIKPWMPTFGAAALASVGFSFYRWTIGAIQVCIWAVCIIAVIALVMFVSDRLETKPKQTKKVLAWATVWLWGPFFLVILAGWLLWEYVLVGVVWKYVLQPVSKPIGNWFFRAHIFKVIYPWSVTLVTSVALGLYFGLEYAPRGTIRALIIIGVVIVVIALVVMLSMYEEYKKEQRAKLSGPVPTYSRSYSAPRRAPATRRRRRSRPSRYSRLMSNIALVFQITWHFVSAKERKICPFVEVEGFPYEPPSSATDFAID